MRHLHLLIKPASGQCNLRCEYCFYVDVTKNREQASFGFMSEEIMENVVKKALDYATQECTFSFQGGEPTLIGLGFYKALIKHVRRFNKKNLVVHYAMQTNGVLLNAEWADFLTENHFLIGLSIDGPRAIHDMYRVDRNGNGSCDKAKSAANLLKKKNIDFNILTVATSEIAKQVYKVYEFYKNNEFFFLQFIPCIDPMFSERGQQKYSLTPELFGQFLCDLFDLWYNDINQRNFIYIRYFENLVGMLKGFPPENCGLSGVCAMHYVIEADGGVYPCDYYVLDKYYLGNLNYESFAAIDNRRKELNFISESIKPHDDCLRCQHGFICRGGCRRDRLINADGTIGKNYFCESYKTFFLYTAKRLVKLSKGNIQYKKIG